MPLAPLYRGIDHRRAACTVEVRGARLNVFLHTSHQLAPFEIKSIAGYLQTPERALRNNLDLFDMLDGTPRPVNFQLMSRIHQPKGMIYALGVAVLPSYLIGMNAQRVLGRAYAHDTEQAALLAATGEEVLPSKERWRTINHLFAMMLTVKRQVDGHLMLVKPKNFPITLRVRNRVCLALYEAWRPT